MLISIACGYLKLVILPLVEFALLVFFVFVVSVRRIWAEPVYVQGWVSEKFEIFVYGLFRKSSIENFQNEYEIFFFEATRFTVKFTLNSTVDFRWNEVICCSSEGDEKEHWCFKDVFIFHNALPTFFIHNFKSARNNWCNNSSSFTIIVGVWPFIIGNTGNV